MNNYTKNEFDKFINENGHYVLVGHTNKNVHCDCYNHNTHESNPDCPECLGMGWTYDWSLTQSRRSATGSANNKGLDFKPPFKLDNKEFNYYFKTEVNIAQLDFILEFMNREERSQYNMYVVRNADLLISEYKKPAYKKISSQKIVDNKKIVNKLLEQMDFSKLESM